ncbi:MAG: hypothetical protein JNJ93_00760, partial [Acinetobacter sp.]|nr:hypothetical protein [Acinetobacter sp.]
LNVFFCRQGADVGNSLHGDAEKASFFTSALWQNLPHREVLIETWNVWHKKAQNAQYKTINNKTIIKKEETAAQKSPGPARAFSILRGLGAL